MQILLEEIDSLHEKFKTNAAKTTNKSAARRARKVAMTIRRKLKEYSKMSIK